MSAILLDCCQNVFDTIDTNQVTAGVNDMDTYLWIILPLAIFFARILDVSLGTMRIISVSRQRRYLAPVLGFFEVFIWIVATSQLMRNLTNIAGYLAYAAGFAAGNFIGLLIEGKLALGMVTVRVFAAQDGELLLEMLHNAGFGVTGIDAHGWKGPVKLIFTTIRRQDLAEVIQIIRNVNPKLFFSVEEVRSASEGVIPHHTRFLLGQRLGLASLRKGK
jgi:uncharacterized protein YebE (UPF0316 family)